MGVLLPLSFDLFSTIYVTMGSPPSFVTNCVDTVLYINKCVIKYICIDLMTI